MSTPAPTPKEIRISTPNVFDGKREDLIPFIQDSGLYLDMNETIYDTDHKRIVFMLSHMKGGTAQAWKEAFITECAATTGYGTLKAFIDRLKEAFDLADAEGDARAKLRKLRQGKESVDEYISQFRVLAGKAKMTDDKALIEYFMEGINQGILTKIFSLKTLPTTISQWYVKASKFDAAY